MSSRCVKVLFTRVTIFASWFLLLLGSNYSRASSNPTDADPELPGALIYPGPTYEAGNEVLYDSLICQEDTLQSPTITQGLWAPVPLEIRRQSLQVCRQLSRKRVSEFDVPDYGYVNLSVTEIKSHFSVFSLRLKDLKSMRAYAKALPYKSTVYMIFDELKNWYSISLVMAAVTRLNQKGYRVVIAQHWDKKSLLDVLADHSTFGVLLDSHGFNPMPLGFFSVGGGQWADSNKQAVYPADLGHVSQNLRFFSTTACNGQILAQEYQSKLNLSIEAYHYLPEEHTNLAINYYFRDDVFSPPESIIRFNLEKPDRIAVDHLRQINFLQQIERLP